MAAIGDYTVLTLAGRPVAASALVETISSAPGENYHRYRRHGLRSPESLLRSTAVAADQSAAEALEAGYLALRSTAVTVVDGMGESHANCMVLDVAVDIVTILPDAAANTRLVRAAWNVRKGAAT